MIKLVEIFLGISSVHAIFNPKCNRLLRRNNKIGIGCSPFHVGTWSFVRITIVQAVIFKVNRLVCIVIYLDILIGIRGRTRYIRCIWHKLSNKQRRCFARIECIPLNLCRIRLVHIACLYPVLQFRLGKCRRRNRCCILVCFTNIRHDCNTVSVLGRRLVQ
ncbi:hypothetical protein D3C76_1279850 [compost metagenome]